MAAHPQSAPEANRVTCQECGKTLVYINSFHLKTHGLTTAQYQEKYPDAPLYTDDFLEKKRQVYADPTKGAAVRAGLEKGRTPQVREKAMATMRANGKVATPAFMGKISKLGWRTDVHDEHAKAIRDAQLKPERRARQSEVANKVWARHQARKALSGKPAWIQVAGNYLLDHPEAANDDVLRHLDMKAKRADRKRWIDLANNQSMKNDLGDVRRLVGIPGRVPRKT